MTRDPSRCDYCREPFANRGRMLHMLDTKMVLAEPIFTIHFSCAYELREELEKSIREIEFKMEDSN